MSPDIMAVTYGVSSALSWGAGDFSGGLATRRGSVLTVVLCSQLVGGMLLVGLALVSGDTLPPWSALRYGAAAGLAGAVGLIALYRGLAGGRMGIVAPLSAVVTALLPIAVSTVKEGLPGGVQICGFIIALMAVMALSYEGGGTACRWHELGLPLLAGIGFGLFFIWIDTATETQLLWPLVAARAASVSLVAAMLLLQRPVRTLSRPLWFWICLTGILDAAGNAFFAMAAQLGRLDVSAVLASLYPAATVLLAWAFLKERLLKHQWAGITAALLALALITH
ncbi:MAG: EamA family transporter [Desulfosarcinaceae bacterium]|nr:EamA family transporter [Desulfosarcinaceae bacterium]